MIRLFQIEWFKLKQNKAFWILIAMYSVSVTVICSSGMLLMEFFKSKGADFRGIDPTIIPLYDFPDVWHNITYIATFLKIIMGFIMIISIANEASYKTLRQNIIDGLSKKEFLLSKLLMIGTMSVGATLLLSIIGTLSGLFYSHVSGWSYMVTDTSFLLVYLFEVFYYLTFALMIALLVRKSGLTIVGLMIYTWVLEPILVAILRYAGDFPDWVRSIAEYLPISAVNNLIREPFSRYIFQEIQGYVAIEDFAVTVVWLVVYLGGSMFILNKKDL